MSKFNYDGVGESAKEREKKYLERYLVVVIDPKTGNQSDLDFDCTRSWIPPIDECVGQEVAKSMRRLKKRLIESEDS